MRVPMFRGVHVLRLAAVLVVLLGAVQMAFGANMSCRQRILRDTHTGYTFTNPGSCFNECSNGGSCAAFSGEVQGHAVDGCFCDTGQSEPPPCLLVWKHAGTEHDTWDSASGGSVDCISNQQCSSGCTSITWTEFCDYNPDPPPEFNCDPEVQEAQGCNCGSSG